MTILQTKDLKKYYGREDTLVKALDGVDLEVQNGEFVAIVGTSIRNHKNGKGGCSCGDSCGGCACAGMCHPEEKK